MSKKDNYFLFVIQAVITISYSSLFTYLLFFARRRRGITDRYLTIIPLKTTISNFLKISGNEHYELFNYCTNLFGNIFLFVPLPFFLIQLARIKSFKTLFLISFILSLSVE